MPEIFASLHVHFRDWLSYSSRSVKSVLDKCTGSGCLAVLAESMFPRASVDAVDISRPALAVAQKNVRAFGLDKRISLIKSDLFKATPSHKYDLIICNPPYVKTGSIRRLQPEFRNEPEMALAGGTDGLDIVCRIISEAGKHLKPAGHLVLEIGKTAEHSNAGL